VAESPYRLGVLLDDGIPGAPEADVTAAWLTDHRKHFRLDKIVELAAVGNEVRAQSIGAAGERAAPMESRIAAAAILAWQRARRLPPGTRFRVVLDGSPIAPAGRLAGLEARPVRLMLPAALATVIVEKNRPTRDALVQSLRSSMGVIPFVGAGLSADFNFPQWGELLRRLARPNQKAQVDTLVRRGDFERAAELLYDRGRAADRLQTGISESFHRPIAEAELAGKAVALLPYLTAGPVITTNYDRVLERAFEIAGRGFTGSIVGAEPDEIVPAIQRNERVLFKIHGDCQTRRGLTLTLGSYEFAYGQRDRRAGRETRDKLQGMLPVLLTNRPFLFLGCSLDTDRTLEIVKEVYDKHARIGHHAILAADYDADEFERREEALAKIGIRVLWYAPGQFGDIRTLLRGLLEAISIEAVQFADGAAPPRTRAGEPAPPAGTGEPSPSARLELPPALRERIRSGRVIYFLGAAASGNLLGGPFYENLARNNNVPSFVRSRSDVAQHIVDRNGRATLVSELVDVIRTEFPAPSAIHRRFAALAGRMERLKREGTRLILMTSNYDQGLEWAFEEQGTKHHLFVYQSHGPYEGRFVHRTAAGGVRIVVRPENLHELDDLEPVVVKMNGGPRLAPNLPDSFAVATRDFYRLAARIPRAFPAFLVKELQARSLLFLAHGLKEPDIEEVIRFRHEQQDGGRSWALKWRPNETGPDHAVSRYWEQLGVDLLWGQIEGCVAGIEAAVGD